eukprot:gnl/TRDRNA2_/TRDRNA2_83170_c0_seq1.p1 gnl/TRDRNA2_/TRDRNA2_83170_c0~~gnl/TRDRNA2_/TRDRNA2_83170_c0_seq1.p1  ORF type:complete len:327 (+),score=39.60 gnl/TRDRNA2_/TRDRNA2_83170_c0_seq1:53-1033(+)
MPPQPSRFSQHGKGGYSSYSGAASAKLTPQSVPPPPPPAARGEKCSAAVDIPSALDVIKESMHPNERAMQRSCVVLEHPNVERDQAEVVLAKLNDWFVPPISQQTRAAVSGGSHRLLSAIIQCLRKFREQPPTAALGCLVASRAATCPEYAQSLAQANALEELRALMDRHQAHGGIQNVCLLVLRHMSEDTYIAAHAVSLGLVPRVLRAMEASTGREVQFNGCGAAVRLLSDNGYAPRSGLQEAAFRAKEVHENDQALHAVANDLLSLVIPRFKDVLCWHWRSGWCRMGARCTYAHGPSDMRGSKRGLSEEDMLFEQQMQQMGGHQ